MTPAEAEAVWSLVGKMGASLAVIAGLIKTLQFLFSLTPTSKLEIRVSKCEQNLEKDLKRLEKHDAEIDAVKKGQEGYKIELEHAVKGINKIGTSQISLLRHMIDGNGIEEMKVEAEDLTKFFIEK